MTAGPTPPSSRAPVDPGAIQASAARRLLEQGRLQEAATLLAEVARTGLSSPALLHAEGALALANGDLALAAARLQASLEGFDANSEAHYQLGRVLKESGQLPAAMQHYDRAIALAPDFWQAHSSRGIVARTLGLASEAVKCQEKVLALRPNEPSAHLNLANALLIANQPDRALTAYEEVLRLRPGEANAERGRVFAEAKSLLFKREFAAALSAHQQAITLESHSPAVLIGLGICLLRDGQTEAAEARFTQARALGGVDAAQCWSLGHQMLHFGRQCRDARYWYERALMQCSAEPPTRILRDYALALIYLDEMALAERVINDVLARDPEDAHAGFFLGLIQLWRDDYPNGFRHYEHRFLAVHASEFLPAGRPLTGAKPWAGEDLAGQHFFLWAEQGAGDALQFLRYLPVLRTRGAPARLDFVLHDDLVGLARASFPDMTILGGSDDILDGQPDYETPLMSLPHLLGTPEDTQPVPIPYLHAAPERITSWRARLGPAERLRVGLVWAGNPDHFRDPQRSLPLGLMAGLNDPRVEFIALQKGPAEAQMESLPDFPIRRIAQDFADFHDTAAAVTLLDLVITVDTSIAHLAGGLGVPVWILLSQLGEWRWGQDREHCRWYPTARLFRQTEEDQWAPVLARVREALQALLASREASIVDG